MLKTIRAQKNPELLKQVQIAIVVAEFHRDIADKLLESALVKLAEANVPEAHIQVVWVPGAIEIPLTVKLLADRQLAHAIIALGAVIRADASHYGHIGAQVSEGCQQVMMTYDMPVIVGVLTVDDKPQTLVQVGQKGVEAAEAALAMISVLDQLVTEQ